MSVASCTCRLSAVRGETFLRTAYRRVASASSSSVGSAVHAPMNGPRGSSVQSSAAGASAEIASHSSSGRAALLPSPPPQPLCAISGIEESAGNPIRGSRKQDLRATGRREQPIEGKRGKRRRLPVLPRRDDEDRAPGRPPVRVESKRLAEHPSLPGLEDERLAFPAVLGLDQVLTAELREVVDF